MDEYKQYYYEARPSAIGKAFGRWVLPNPPLPPSTQWSPSYLERWLPGSSVAFVVGVAEEGEEIEEPVPAAPQKVVTCQILKDVHIRPCILKQKLVNPLPSTK